MTSLLANPPLPGGKSCATFQEEKSNVLESLASRMTSLVNGLNHINGITCQPVEGSLYAFPSVNLPPQSINAAEASGECPDAFYCMSLLEKTGICVVPASDFGGIPESNRFGFRITCVFPDDKTAAEAVDSISKHHDEFCQLYTCDSPRKSLQTSKQPKLKCLDHYTLICENAERVAQFHIDYLGFRFLRTVDVNTGTVDQNDIDMKNYVLQPPGNPHMSVVITEGLNDDTIFRKYMKRYGAGIHHVAFEVDDVKGAFQYLRANGVRTTSDTVTTDMLSGLKQFFIDPVHAGFYIELIERPSDSKCIHPPLVDRNVSMQTCTSRLVLITILVEPAILSLQWVTCPTLPIQCTLCSKMMRLQAWMHHGMLIRPHQFCTKKRNWTLAPFN